MMLTNKKQTLLLFIVMVNLTGCEELSSSSSNAKQEFTAFSPNVQPLPEPEPEPEPEPDTPANKGSVAGTGIVWKPVSEGDGKLVVLTPTSYGSPSVSVLNAAGKTVEKGRYVGRTNGNRATYRFSKSGAKYSAPSYLKVGSSIFSVPSPRSRYN